MNKELLDTLRTYKYKNSRNENDNFAITIKIDADIEQYFRNIEAVTLIEILKSKGEIDTNVIGKKEYINRLIREDMLKTLGVSKNEKDPNKWIGAYTEYAKEYGIRDQK